MVKGFDSKGGLKTIERLRKKNVEITEREKQKRVARLARYSRSLAK